MRAIAIWIWFCGYLNCVGWGLSAIHQLNAVGYAIALAIWFAAFFIWQKRTFEKILAGICWRKIRWRFRKLFPLAFLVLTVMAIVGGVLYPPTNYDALAYRVPRILHWLAAGQWHWVHTVFGQINNRSCGIEWVSTPLIALLRTDRLLFLINSISFLFLPGLVFSLLTRLNVQRRVAWHWMWIAPTGYGFLLQAGSIGNDLFGAPFALAAVDFALRAKNSKCSGHFFTSILAAAMMTSAKTSDLPLLLPWAIAIWPSLKWIFRRPVATALICVMAVFASALPTIYFNLKYSGDWSGARLHHGETRVRYATVLKTGANIVLITIENFVPPVFPFAEKWNRVMDEHLPPALETSLTQIMEAPGNKFHLEQMQIEENAGLGSGVSALLLISVVAAAFARKKNYVRNESLWLKIVRISPWLSFAAVLTQSNLSAIARVLTPYYLLLLPVLLASAGHEQLVRKAWWRTAAMAVCIIAAGLLIVSPARPLFPVQTILLKISGETNSRVATRITEVYTVYRCRSDAFASVRDSLPPDVKILGAITADDPETSLWLPFGSRRIKHICPEDTAADLKARGIKYVLVKNQMFGQSFPGTFDEWAKKVNAQVIQNFSLNLRASTGPLDWSLVKLN